MSDVNDIDYRWNRIGEIINSYGKEDDKIAWMLCRGDSAEWKIKSEELEQQNNELMEFAKEMREIGKLNPDRLPEYTDIIYHHANDLITRITGGER